MDTTPYAEIASVMQADIDQMEALLKQLRVALKSIAPLAGTTEPRPTKRREQIDVPDGLRELSHPARILLVMNTDPDQEWKCPELARLAFTGTAEAARTALRRLAEQGKVTITDSHGWILQPRGTTPT